MGPHAYHGVPEALRGDDLQINPKARIAECSIKESDVFAIGKAILNMVTTGAGLAGRFRAWNRGACQLLWVSIVSNRRKSGKIISLRSLADECHLMHSPMNAL
jgi:hypothetical protein